MPANHSGAFVNGSLSEAMHVVIGWVEEVHGCRGFENVLGSLQSLLGADSISLLRLRSDTAAETVFASVTGREAPPRSDRLSFPQYLLGHGIGRAQAGSVWYMSELERELSNDDIAGKLPRFGHEQVREIAVIVLASSPRACDVIEVEFTRRLPANEADALSMLSVAFARAWLHRVEELWPVSEGTVAVDSDGSSSTSGQPILSPLNPARLSRSEYRVCTLLSRGLGAKKISAALNVSELTVRSHLRSIYAKTRTNGQRELMFRMLRSDGGRGGDPLAMASGVVDAGERITGSRATRSQA